MSGIRSRDLEAHWVDFKIKTIWGHEKVQSYFGCEVIMELIHLKREVDVSFIYSSSEFCCL